MESLKEVFKIGCGPSSSHTMGPERAAKKVKEKYPQATSYRVHLCGSLAATGKGHMTDWIIAKTFEPKHTEIIWNPTFIHPYHTNYLKIEALNEKKRTDRLYGIFLYWWRLYKRIKKMVKLMKLLLKNHIIYKI